MTPLKNLRVANVQPLLPPASLMEEIPMTDGATQTVAEGRNAVASVLEGKSDRFIVVCGPHQRSLGVRRQAQNRRGPFGF
jgi:3-deoxy-7-phosphoheptulonate synthase